MAREVCPIRTAPLSIKKFAAQTPLLGSPSCSYSETLLSWFVSLAVYSLPSIETLRQDMDSVFTRPVCVPLAACPNTVRDFLRWLAGGGSGTGPCRRGVFSS